ncbi:MAG TPA: flagellar export chaperone FliS [Terriglobales bacterium]|jgi:flagellar protein FliS|nr:flagellar export chaperone FliS [Terriglobales bacterium]
MIDLTATYRKSQANGASRVGLVVSLYEGLIADLARAVAATEKGNLAKRSAELQHALTILGYLQGTLDFDRGGEVARGLNRFYCVTRAQIMEGQVQASPAILNAVIASVTEVCDAWRHIDETLRQQESPVAGNSEGISWTA